MEKFSLHHKCHDYVFSSQQAVPDIVHKNEALKSPKDYNNETLHQYLHNLNLNVYFLYNPNNYYRIQYILFTIFESLKQMTSEIIDTSLFQFVMIDKW